ncbi:winged helix-turn-helix domain-containing protein [Desulfolutivibrio sulfoxidireducens]|uniref:winged helix-turn-helix domain-containing protein n=1 Tax=Desulfolutivibrio sulfoxidireducens TaxID=2773299 RepID=UPI001C3FFE4C|nr:LysR family transcriptional regulator [Desulfolutivibrio sulfoxidireducens]
MSLKTTIRLHLWLETGDTMVFGMGRVQLLDMIERLGSLRKAASAMGMSYRAAWCKLRATEQALGVKLVEAQEHKRDGVRLTAQGQVFREMFRRWFDEVENCALTKAEGLFPWPVAGFFEEREREAPPPSSPRGLSAAMP